MSRIILTHVGITALLAPALAEFYTGDVDVLRRKLQQDRVSPHELAICIRDMCDGLMTIWSPNFASGPQAWRERSPAEIAVLSLLQLTNDDVIVLLHSETQIGEFCARLIESALQIDSIPPDREYPYCGAGQIRLKQLDNVKISDDGNDYDLHDPFGTMNMADTFVRKGLPNYVTQVWEMYQQLLKDGGGELIFNITSGYKGLIPIARDLSTLLTSYSRDRGHNITSELCYLYQNSKEMIHIPALPLKFDWSKIPAESLSMTNDNLGIALESIPSKDIVEYSAYFVINHDTKRIYRSVLGELVWAMVKHVNDTLKLDGIQMMEFRNALAVALTSIFDLKQIVRFGLDENLDRIVNMPNNLDGACFELIEWAQARGRTRDLLRFMRKENPENSLLQGFAQQFGE